MIVSAVVSILFFYLSIYLLKKTWLFYGSMSYIPTPKDGPFFGNLFYYMAKPNAMIRKIRILALNYYPIYRLSIFYFSIVAILDPNDVELVLSSTKHLSKSRVYSYLHKWLGTGLLTSTGQKWQKRRKILTPAFHFEVLQEFVTIFNEETEKLVQVFENKIDKEFDVVPLVTNFTLRSIGETAMGFRNVTEETYLKYKQAAYRMGQILINRISKPWLHLSFLYNLSSVGTEEKKVVKVLRNFSETIIAEKEKEVENVDKTKRRLAMLDLLLRAKKQGVDIDNEGIREEVDTFMFEGHDTTAMAISFILLVLSNEIEAQTKIAEEILSVLGPTKQPSLQDLQSLRYTERCIKECLRLFPSVPLITRRASEDFQTTTGYTIWKNTILHIHIFDIHRNPFLYPDPLKFDPDRFLPEIANKRHPFAYIPFSAGSRNCIGQKFALFELKAVLCGILRNYQIEKVQDMFDVDFKADLVLRPKKEVRIRIKRKNI